MKKTLTVMYGLLFLTASATLAEQYKAPKIQFSKHPATDGGMKKEGWNNNYQVKERVDAERELASDDDSEYRGDSPGVDFSAKPALRKRSVVKPWHFEIDSGSCPHYLFLITRR